MQVEYSTFADFEGWLALAREVEPLFGPMADLGDFQEGLKQAIAQQVAFCVREENPGKQPGLKGGVVISKEYNEIAWLAVSAHARGQGMGRALLTMALEELDSEKNILVQTFAPTVPEGKPARDLYLSLGFKDHKDGGLNPAGVPTVIMRSSAGRVDGENHPFLLENA